MITRGSEWRRWEPHIHAPGTVLNNQFGGGDPWATNLATLEARLPRIEAIAATDYYVTDTYEQICTQLAACIADPRDPSRVIHALDDILRARIFAITRGYEDADDLDALERGRLVQCCISRRGFTPCGNTQYSNYRTVSDRPLERRHATACPRMRMKMAGVEGLEPTALGFGDRCSTN